MSNILNGTSRSTVEQNHLVKVAVLGKEMSQGCIILDKWLSEILLCPAYKVAISGDLYEDTTSFISSLDSAVKANPAFAFAKVDPANLKHVHFLEQFGFRLIDTNVQFDKTVQPGRKYMGNCTLRFARNDDEQAAVALGQNSFSYSRFHLDTKIRKHTADTIKGEWVRNYFIGKRGDAMVIAEIDGEVIGFLQLIHQADVLVIDLIAVDDRHRRKGIAGDMIFFAETNGGNFTRIKVGTQITNIPSMRMYEGLGFKICSSSYVFHYHNKTHSKDFARADWPNRS